MIILTIIIDIIKNFLEVKVKENLTH